MLGGTKEKTGQNGQREQLRGEEKAAPPRKGKRLKGASLGNSSLLK